MNSQKLNKLPNNTVTTQGAITITIYCPSK